MPGYKPTRIITAALIGGLLLGCGPSDSPEVSESVGIISSANWLAYQDGPGKAWRVLEKNNDTNAPNSYTFRVSDPDTRFGLAMVCSAKTAEAEHRLSVFYGTSKEVWRIRTLCENTSPNPETTEVSGNIYGVNVDNGEMALLAFNDNEAFVNYNAYARVVTTGRHDLLAYKGHAYAYDNHGILQTAITPERFFIARDVTINSVADVFSAGPSVNFDSSSVIVAAPVDHSVDLRGAYTVADGNSRVARVGYVSKNRNYLPLSSAKNDDTAMTYRGVPLYAAADTEKKTPLQNADEGHEAAVELQDAGGKPLKAAYQFFKEPIDVDLPLPEGDPSDNVPVVTVTSSDNYEASWRPSSDAHFGSAQLYLLQIAGQSLVAETAASSRWDVYITPGWLGDAQALTEYALATPNFAALDGWDEGWAVDVHKSGVSWMFQTYLSNSTALEILDYVLRRDVVDGLSFGSIYYRSTL